MRKERVSLSPPNANTEHTGYAFLQNHPDQTSCLTPEQPFSLSHTTHHQPHPPLSVLSPRLRSSGNAYYPPPGSKLGLRRGPSSSLPSNISASRQQASAPCHLLLLDSHSPAALLGAAPEPPIHASSWGDISVASRVPL